jgi:hypothetical protein
MDHFLLYNHSGENMDTAVYKIASKGEGWVVLHDGNEAGPYVTKEAAFQAAIGPISLTIQDGLAVQLNIEAGQKSPAVP